MASPICRKISATETWPLRQAILRPHQSLERMNYPGDLAVRSIHFGSFTSENLLVGIASLYQEDQAEGRPGSGWRLRGMATHANVRGQGFGRALIATCIDHVSHEGGLYLWCNARLSAAPFYEKLSFKIVSGEFPIENLGPHVIMRREILSS